jgi:hypothetical protein
MPKIGNKFNFFMLLVGFIALIIWLAVQNKYTRTARQNGTLE